MRKLVYELMAGNKVVKRTTNYLEVVEWDKEEGHWNRVELEEMPKVISEKAEKAKEKHRKRVAEVAGWTD